MEQAVSAQTSVTDPLKHLLNDYRSAAAALSEYRMKHFPHGTRVVVAGNPMSISDEGSFERRATVLGNGWAPPDCVPVQFKPGDGFVWVHVKNLKVDTNLV